jgi:hypothetical protein
MYKNFMVRNFNIRVIELNVLFLEIIHQIITSLSLQQSYDTQCKVNAKKHSDFIIF